MPGFEEKKFWRFNGTVYMTNAPPDFYGMAGTPPAGA